MTPKVMDSFNAIAVRTYLFTTGAIRGEGHRSRRRRNKTKVGTNPDKVTVYEP